MVSEDKKQEKKSTKTKGKPIESQHAKWSKDEKWTKNFNP